MNAGRRRSEGEIEAWLVREIAHVLEIPENEVERDRNVLELGLGSRRIVAISGRLQKWLTVKLPPTLLFEYPTIEEVAAHLSNNAGDEGVGDRRPSRSKA